MCTFIEKVVCSKIYLQGGVLKMHVVYFGEGRDGSPHDGIIIKKKKHEKVFINVKCKCDFLGSTKIT